MSKPIIFLDIDGVLNSYQTIVPQDQAALDPVNITPFNRIIAETQAEIVITSTWRYWHSVNELTTMFMEAEIEGDIVDVTPSTTSTEDDHRGTEIYAWLRDHRSTEWASGNGRFVLLDDRADLEPYLDRLVLTKMDIGLTEQHADEAIKLLKA